MELRINGTIRISPEELVFRASRSKGPGGQHVNKVSSRVSLHFDVRGSASLTERQKHLISSRLASRMTKQGVLLLHSQRYRSQSANRKDLVERFGALLRQGLQPRRPRVPTRRPSAKEEERLREKKRRGQIKKGRAVRAIREPVL